MEKTRYPRQRVVPQGRDKLVAWNTPGAGFWGVMFFERLLGVVRESRETPVGPRDCGYELSVGR